MKKLVVLAVCLLATACGGNSNGNNNNVPSQYPASALNGTWSGTFTVTYSGTPFPGLGQVESGVVKVTFAGEKYSATGNTNHVPTSASGSFSVSGTEMVFESEAVYAADFDTNLVLAGNYEYILSDGKLTLTKTVSRTTYQYVLTKG